jgi:hypothetical protein
MSIEYVNEKGEKSPGQQMGYVPVNSPQGKAFLDTVATTSTAPRRSPREAATSVYQGAAAALNADPYRGRKVIDDKDYAAYQALGYTDADLRKKYIPKAEKKIAEQMGDMYWDAPVHKAADKDKEATDSQSMRSMVTQMVLGPYIRQLGDQFNQQRSGIQATQDQLIKQIAPEYQPYVQAMQNAQTQAQDSSWGNTLNNLSIQPVMDKQNQLIADYIKQMQASSSTGNDPYLQALMTGQVAGG